ncbi:T9SS type A sorting domain-containing protein [Flavobacteriales bacterium]|nr:T9SS type A sorting domain-containing protein [Flavobacteriales bacterium]
MFYKKSTFTKGENLITLAANQIPSGVYLVNVVAGNVSWNEKLVIQKD